MERRSYRYSVGCFDLPKLLFIIILFILSYRLYRPAFTNPSAIETYDGGSSTMWNLPIIDSNSGSANVSLNNNIHTKDTSKVLCEGIRKMKSIPVSSVHCIGETFNESRTHTPASLYRSCQYENLCYDLHQDNFVLLPSDKHWALLSSIHSNIHISSISKPVMVSEVLKRNPGETAKVTPKYINHSFSNEYFETNMSDTVWIPIKPESCESVLWDIYLPVYTLLEIFGLESKPYHLFLLPGSNCTQNDLEDFDKMFGISNFQITGLSLGECAIFSRQKPLESRFLCFEKAVMGIGAHGDHQAYRPQNENDRSIQKRIPPNHIRRQTNLRGFRNHFLERIKRKPQRSRPFIVAYSSSIPDSWMPTKVPNLVFKKWSSTDTVSEQLKIALASSVWIARSNEDKTVAFFLPEGAALILIGHAEEDWDLLSNNAQLRVHLVVSQIQSSIEILIRDELRRLLDEPTEVMIENRIAEKVRLDENNRTVTLIRGSPPTSRVHCVGEKIYPNHLAADWYRSCHFENICFDLEEKIFVIFPSPLQIPGVGSLNDVDLHSNYFSTTLPNKLIMSPQLNKLGSGYQYYSDLPKVRSGDNVSSYYLFDGVWLGSRTYNSGNTGHILWDIWLPHYSILEMFGLTNESLYVSRYPSPSDAKPHKIFEKIFGFPARITKNEAIHIPGAEARYVCARHGGGGYGWLMDHGVGDHGWKDVDLEYPVNLRRGPELGRFREYILEKMGILSKMTKKDYFIVTFSINSSRKENRRINFAEEIVAVRKLQFARAYVKVKSSHLVDYPLESQVRIASATNIFISVVGGGTLPAFFLPKGASLILYGDKEMYLDFDLFNNYANLRVHWMSFTTRKNDTEILLNLIQDEIEFFTRSRSK